MSDDWNISRTRMIKATGMENIDGGELYIKFEGFKILREELLGDFAYWLALDRQGRVDGDDFIKMVNKRFGVKE